MIAAFPRPGARCWATHSAGYYLPEGLPDRSELVILRWHEFAGTVRDANGKEWELVRTQIDTGLFLHLNGQLCHESNPLFASYLRHSLAGSDGPPRQPDWMRWLLERNGYDPAEPPPPGPPPALGAAPSRAPERNARTPRRMNS